MKKFRSWQNFRGIIFVTAIFAITIQGCREDHSHEQASDLEWIQSRQGTHRYAYLTRKDLNDRFLLGASVIKVDNFLSNALNMVIRPVEVSLDFQAGQGNSGNLIVRAASDNSKLLDLETSIYRGFWEVDFASSGNDLEFNQTLDVIGGVYTASDSRGRWVSQGPPEILSIQQDENTAVIDLEHTVHMAMVETDASGRKDITPHGNDEGRVVIRLWLKRKDSLPDFGEFRTVGAAADQNLGFFGANFVPDTGEEYQTAIQRFKLPQGSEEKITFYLKDFPQEYLNTASRAVLSWNDAFGRDVLEVREAPAKIDAGDPRYHVIKWFDGTDSLLRWAGVAKMIVHPVTGLVMSGSIYIQGDTLLNMYQKLHADSVSITSGPEESGILGGLRFHTDAGEAPVIPYLTDPNLIFEEYMQGYYLETIAHEVGHVLGLRHNFMASVVASETSASASVMDYSPRNERHEYSGPGFYDVAAIRWAYFGEEPSATLPFCTDEDVENLWNCNRGDHGDPISFVLSSLKDGTRQAAVTPFTPRAENFFSTMKGVAETAWKIWQKRSQLPESHRRQYELALPFTLDYILTELPSPLLSAEGQEMAQTNLNAIRENITEVFEPEDLILPGQPPELNSQLRLQ